MKIGILGAGSIAEKMAFTVGEMDGVTVEAIGSRTIEKAKRFAEKFKIPKAYGSYEELAADDSLDLIYIATPHSRHYEDALLCLNSGRNVLCEKAFTANAKQAKHLIDVSREKKLYLAEAIWTRYLPMRFMLDELLQNEIIGEVTSLTADLGYTIDHVERLIKPELAGGALLDLGVYTIHFARMAFGIDIVKTTSSCVKNEYGVDVQNSIIYTFADGKVAMLHSNMRARTDLRGIIYGTDGRIEFENINNCEGIRVIMNDGTEIEYETPEQITGFEYQVLAAKKAIEEGKTECSEIPLDETLAVMKLMDELREEWGICYPFEN